MTRRYDSNNDKEDKEDEEYKKLEQKYKDLKSTTLSLLTDLCTQSKKLSPSPTKK